MKLSEDLEKSRATHANFGGGYSNLPAGISLIHRRLPGTGSRLIF